MAVMGMKKNAFKFCNNLELRQGWILLRRKSLPESRKPTGVSHQVVQRTRLGRWISAQGPGTLSIAPGFLQALFVSRMKFVKTEEGPPMFCFKQESYRLIVKFIIYMRHRL